MSYEQNRKKIELEDSRLHDLEGTVVEVIDSITSQYENFLQSICNRYGVDTFILIEDRYGYYQDTATPHLIAYRWETKGEFNSRMSDEKARSEIIMKRELETLRQLKEKYEK